MLDTITPKSLARYQRNRTEELPLLFERLARITALPALSVHFDKNGKNECRLDRDGVTITINPSSIDELTLRSGFGVVDTLPLALGDLLVITHEIYRADAFTDTSFFIEPKLTSIKSRKSRIFFNTLIDDYTIDNRLRGIPLFKHYFNAYISRLILHDARGKPSHIQLMDILGIMLLESTPTFLCDQTILDTIEHLDTRLRSEGLSLATFFDHRRPYAERHRLADEHLYPLFRAFFMDDCRKYDRYLIEQSYDREILYGNIASPDLQELQSIREQDFDELIEELYRVTEADISKETLETLSDAGTVSENEDVDDSPGLMLPRSGEVTEEFELLDNTMSGYLSTVGRWHQVIKSVADILLKLATPQESIAVPRYRAQASNEGVRFNPRAITQAYLQLETSHQQAIWQTIEKVIRQQDLRFCGLDIYLLFDVSGSMGGTNAPYAAATAICLMEGLHLARSRAQADPKQGQVDVRTQLLAFGSGWAELTPLCKELDQNQKELAYFNLMHPSSNFTQINGALKHLRTNAAKNLERNVLCLIISDGLFSDNREAFKTVRSMPHNVYIGHINIGDSIGIPITPHFEAVPDPRVLPKKLNALLEEYFKSVSQKL